jgi:hypothetical protein
MTNTQLTLSTYGNPHQEKVVPYAAGDILVRTKDHERVVVERVERDPEAKEPEVLLCISLVSGLPCILFPREIAWRSC